MSSLQKVGRTFRFYNDLKAYRYDEIPAGNNWDSDKNKEY